jgi:hypothetical protein
MSDLLCQGAGQRERRAEPRLAEHTGQRRRRKQVNSVRLSTPRVNLPVI